MKKIALVLILAGSLAACNEQEKPTPTEDTIQTLEESQSMVPMADSSGDQMVTDMNAVDDMPLKNEEELEAEEEAQAVQAAADEAKNNPIAIVNTGNTNRNYVLRDADTGCEFIQFDDTGTDGTSLPIVARPNGRGGQRGCGTGTDFKKAN